MFLLDGFDFWLDFLEFFLTLEHMLLWDEEDETDDERDDDDSPAELVTRDPGDECDEQIIDRLIDYSRYHRTK